jgi:hypothetical protein
VPLEGQYKRQQTSLRRMGTRERQILSAVIVVIVLACVATAIAAVSVYRTPVHHRGCVEVTAAGVMGAQVQHACGTGARQFCASTLARRDNAYGALVRQACRQAHITAP